MAKANDIGALSLIVAGTCSVSTEPWSLGGRIQARMHQNVVTYWSNEVKADAPGV